MIRKSVKRLSEKIMPEQGGGAACSLCGICGAAESLR
jgi:hypothetical protein